MTFLKAVTSWWLNPLSIWKIPSGRLFRSDSYRMPETPSPGQEQENTQVLGQLLSPGTQLCCSCKILRFLPYPQGVRHSIFQQQTFLSNHSKERQNGIQFDQCYTSYMEHWESAPALPLVHAFPVDPHSWLMLFC